MKKIIRNYEQPEIEIIEIAVEKGYNSSEVEGGGSTGDAGGSDDFEPLF